MVTMIPKVKPHSFLGRFLRLSAEVDDSFSWNEYPRFPQGTVELSYPGTTLSLRPGLEPCTSRSSPLSDHDDHEIIVDITLGVS